MTTRAHRCAARPPRFSRSLAALAVLAALSVPLGFEPAQAQSLKSATCRTPAVSARISTLYGRIERYQSRLEDLRQERATLRQKLTAQGRLNADGNFTGHGVYADGQRYLDLGGAILFHEERIKEMQDEMARLERLPPCGPPRHALAPQASTPQVGMVVEPKIAIGAGGSSGTAKYDSTGTQAPFDGDWSRSTGQLCGGLIISPGMVGAVRVGVDVNVCSGSNFFNAGDTTLFQIMRHGPGDVVLRSSTDLLTDLFVTAEAPLAVFDQTTNRWFVSVGVGPTFRRQTLTLTSDQSFFGGGVPSTSASTWQAGFGVSAGLATFLCPNCIAGNPLKVGVEGRARFFPSQSISLRSPAFGFVETGSTGTTTDYSALLTMSVPLSGPIVPGPHFGAGN